MHVTGLFIYPVKSLGGFAVPSLALDALGPVGDRRFLVIDANGRTLTQREIPKMALVETQLTATDLVLRHTDLSPLTVPLRVITPVPSVIVSVWSSKDLIAEDCGADAALWLSSALGHECRLVRIGSAFRRPVLDPARAFANDIVTFADAYPLLVISEASLADLNDRLIGSGEEALPMNRFRPNLVIGDCAPYAEDSWSRIQIGEVTLRAGGPCSRCIVTTTDQTTAARGKEPLRTLAKYRRDVTDPGSVNFGQNLIHETKSGVLQVGMELKVL